MEKENNDKSDFSENEKPDLNSLKPFKFESRTNIEDIISSNSDDQEGAEYKVKPISNNEWCECSAVQKHSFVSHITSFRSDFNRNQVDISSHQIPP